MKNINIFQLYFLLLCHFFLYKQMHLYLIIQLISEHNVINFFVG